jgi:hypothetical protein
VKKQLLLLVLAIVMLAKTLPAFAQSTIAGYSLDARLQAAVSSTGTVLDDGQKAQLIMRCSNAQTILLNLQKNTPKLIEERLTIYGDIQQDLQAIKLRMIRQGADASEADLLTGKIQQALDDFSIAANSYSNALSDVINVNCQQQPEFFKAGLIMLRIDRAELYSEAVQLKAVVMTADTDIFNQLKKRLVT